MDDLSELLIDEKTDEKFNRLFKSALKKNKLSIEKQGSKNYYIITDGRHTLDFDISSEKYRYAKSLSDNEALAATERIKRDFAILERLVSFTNGQEFLRYTVMRSEETDKRMITESFIGGLKKVICYTSDDVKARILDESYMKKWDVPPEVLFAVADRNMCRLLKRTEYTESVIAADMPIKCIDFKAEGSDFAAALMMCGDFADFVSEKLGKKFLAAAPSKDSVTAISAVTDKVLERLGAAVAGEYRWSTRPLTSDILLYDGQSIETLGGYRY